MGGEEGISNGESSNGAMGEKIEPWPNGFPGTGTGSGDDSLGLSNGATGGKFEPWPNGFPGSGDDNLGRSEGLRTYKRRKHAMSVESKGDNNGRGSVEASSEFDFGSETMKKPLGKSFASLDSFNSAPHSECRNFVLKRIYESLYGSEGGIFGCIRDALKMTVKDCDAVDKDIYRNRQASQSDRGGMDIGSNKSSGDSHRPITKMCQHAFFNILLSERFTLLCKLLFDNFQESNPAGILLSFSRINTRMKDGVYERSPFLFIGDIQLIWKRLEGIGEELLSLAKSLSVVSRTSYDELFRPQQRHSHGKTEQVEGCSAFNVCKCRVCGAEADGKDCLACDFCEDMFHVSCIDPPVKEIPPKCWFCVGCTTEGLISHENCAPCERLNAPRVPFTQASDENRSPTVENVSREFEETSNHLEDGIHQPLAEGKNVCFCKICRSEVGNGEKLKICEHAVCFYKYYHVRCLSIDQLKSHGPLWYCPSCLCRGCLCDKDDHEIVLCDSCDHAYHMYCMSPPRTSIPPGKWFCKPCEDKMKEIRKVKKAYMRRENRKKKKAEEDKRAHENFESKVDEKCGQDSGKDRMNMLLTAVLCDEKFAALSGKDQ